MPENSFPPNILNQYSSRFCHTALSICSNFGSRCFLNQFSSRSCYNTHQDLLEKWFRMSRYEYYIQFPLNAYLQYDIICSNFGSRCLDLYLCYVCTKSARILVQNVKLPILNTISISWFSIHMTKSARILVQMCIHCLVNKTA